MDQSTPGGQSTPHDQLTLGIGTRLQHTQYGPGVIVGVKYAVYQISFIHHGIKEIDKQDPNLDEIIPENVTAEIETHSEVETSLLKILRLWGGLTETVPLGDKWKGGTELRRSFVPRSFSFVTFAALGYPPVRRPVHQTKRSTHRRFLP